MVRLFSARIYFEWSLSRSYLHSLTWRNVPVEIKLSVKIHLIQGLRF